MTRLAFAAVGVSGLWLSTELPPPTGEWLNAIAFLLTPMVFSLALTFGRVPPSQVLVLTAVTVFIYGSAVVATQFTLGTFGILGWSAISGSVGLLIAWVHGRVLAHPLSRGLLALAFLGAAASVPTHLTVQAAVGDIDWCPQAWAAHVLVWYFTVGTAVAVSIIRAE
jgi:hypothetical protein